jgi:hypothetical protein
MEALASLGFLLIGLGFFIFVIRMIERDDRVEHERRIMEQREFGFREVTQAYADRSKKK